MKPTSQACFAELYRSNKVSLAMKSLSHVLLLVCLLIGTSAALPGDHLKPGTKLPKVKALNQFDKKVKLKKLLGPEGALLVVFRSADW